MRRVCKFVGQGGRLYASATISQKDAELDELGMFGVYWKKIRPGVYFADIPVGTKTDVSEPSVETKRKKFLGIF